jgi:hypothetical protein
MKSIAALAARYARACEKPWTVVQKQKTVRQAAALRLVRREESPDTEGRDASR